MVRKHSAEVLVTTPQSHLAARLTSTAGNAMISQAVSSEDFVEMGRNLGELQRELAAMRNRNEDREKTSEAAMEALEGFILTKDDDNARRLREHSAEIADQLNGVRTKFFTHHFRVQRVQVHHSTH